ncbi:MAG: HIT domain-containing protein [Chloroflexota bacterium]
MNNHEPENYKCPFCRIINSKSEFEREVIVETENVFACLPLQHFPDSGPSVLIIPKRHVENIYDISNELLSEVICLAKEVAMTMKSLWGLDGITLWQHNEPAGSQDVWHFHLHVNSRRQDDNLYRSIRFNKVNTSSRQRVMWVSELSEAIENSRSKRL